MITKQPLICKTRKLFYLLLLGVTLGGVHLGVQLRPEWLFHRALRDMCAHPVHPPLSAAQWRSGIQKRARDQGLYMPFENIFLDGGSAIGQGPTAAPAQWESVGYVLPLTLSIGGVVAYPIVVVRSCVPLR